MSETRVRESPNESDHSNDRLTALGYIVVAITGAITFGVAMPLTRLLIPGWFVVVPSVAIGLGLWVVAFVVCERLGIPLMRPRREGNDSSFSFDYIEQMD